MLGLKGFPGKLTPTSEALDSRAGEVRVKAHGAICQARSTKQGTIHEREAMMTLAQLLTKNTTTKHEKQVQDKYANDMCLHFLHFSTTLLRCPATYKFLRSMCGKQWVGITIEQSTRSPVRKAQRQAGEMYNARLLKILALVSVGALPSQSGNWQGKRATHASCRWRPNATSLRIRQ